jgi:hypothetical protein
MVAEWFMAPPQSTRSTDTARFSLAGTMGLPAHSFEPSLPIKVEET